MLYRYSQCELLHVYFVLFAEKCSTGVAEVLLALSSNFCREAGEVPTDENGVVGAITVLLMGLHSGVLCEAAEID